MTYVTPGVERFRPTAIVYFLNCEDALSNAFFIDAHAVSTPVCMCCHADSLAARISCSFLLAASRLARMALICSSYFARASALISWLLARSLSTSASHFLICASIIVKYSSLLVILRLLCHTVGYVSATITTTTETPTDNEQIRRRSSCSH